MISHHFTVSSSGERLSLTATAEGFLLGDESDAPPVQWGQVIGYSEVDSSSLQLHLDGDQTLVVTFTSADERDRFTALVGKYQVGAVGSGPVASPVPINPSAPRAPLRFSAGSHANDTPTQPPPASFSATGPQAGEPPSLIPTIVSSVLLGPFGAIWAHQAAGVARAKGGDPSRYWKAFAISWALSAVVGLTALIAIPALVLSLAVNDSAQSVLNLNTGAPVSTPSDSSGSDMNTPSLQASELLATAAAKCGSSTPQTLTPDTGAPFETTTIDVHSGEGREGAAMLACLVNATGGQHPEISQTEWQQHLTWVGEAQYGAGTDAVNSLGTWVGFDGRTYNVMYYENTTAAGDFAFFTLGLAAQ